MAGTVSKLALALAAMAGAAMTAAPAVAAAKTEQIAIEYKVPANPDFKPMYEILRQQQVLEKTEIFLSPFKLPRKVVFQFSECAGEDDAFYGDNTITMCYELVKRLVDTMPKDIQFKRFETVDTVIGPLVDTILHEFAHALFDILRIPLLGREEDAADQVAAYIYLQFDEKIAKRLVFGTAYNFYTESQAAGAAQTRDQFNTEFSEVHSTPMQRAFNLLCMAYGSDPEAYQGLVELNFLPEERAETCGEEYEQVQDAVEALIRPHVDMDKMREISDSAWLERVRAKGAQWRGSVVRK